MKSINERECDGSLAEYRHMFMMEKALKEAATKNDTRKKLEHIRLKRG